MTYTNADNTVKATVVAEDNGNFVVILDRQHNIPQHFEKVLSSRAKVDRYVKTLKALYGVALVK